MSVSSNPFWKHLKRGIQYGFLLIGFALCTLVILLAYWPVPVDPVIPIHSQGGGARQSPESISGLQANWPDYERPDSRQAALGKLLFYDPILSVSNDRSCASCHHPDLGFSDGRQIAIGAHGDLRRNTPSLWNVAYARSLFWDGRASSLEEQMLEPLTRPDEMGSSLDHLVRELRTIPEYQELFQEAFEDGLNATNILTAIAAYERTLVSNNSPFDQFAAGDFDALTPQQRRGFNLFRSAQARCFECHAWPTFTHETIHILGTPDLDPDDPDYGVIEIRQAADGERGFETPSLRNVALSAPYMHNGVFATLEEVIDFYAAGGGRSETSTVDEKLRGFELTQAQEEELVAFLHALTDEPLELISIPEQVPSGLPIVEARENPARQNIIEATASNIGWSERDVQTIRVQVGERIQSAVDMAHPGDTILVEPGTYYETVYVDTPFITIRGIIQGEERPWLDGENKRSDGFNTTGNDFTLEGFGIRGYIGNGVLSTGAERVVYRNLIIEGTYGDSEVNTIYGLYPVECTGILIEHTIVTGIADAAIYVGQSKGPIIVRNNEVFENVTGIEIENSTNAEVYDNHVYNNSGGILVFLLPNNPSKVGYNTRVYNNLIENNNHPNFAAEGAIVGLVPPGTGIMILTADNTEVFQNTIRGNQTAGLALTSLYMIYDRDTEFDLGPIPENNLIYDNLWSNNGTNPQGIAAELGLPGADILWTGDGWSNSFEEPNASKFPPLLPTRNWPTPTRRLIWRIYDLLVQALL